MASFNLGSFTSNFFNWFEKPPHPISLPNLFSLTLSPKPLFSSLSLSPNSPKKPSENPSNYQQMLEQYYWECENRPDVRHTPQVEKLLKEDPIFETKENPTEEELEENKRWWEEFRKNPVVEFLIRAEEIADMINEMELKENEKPYRSEDKKLWKSVPHVRGLDGRPMVRKTIKSKRESDDKFWDFARQFFFGLWGFRQRPYPPGKPIDAAQAIGYKRLEKRYYDFIMKTGGWFYKDRLGRSRGPCELIQLKTAWGAGIIDTDTFIWGEDMDEWAPIGMVYGLEPAIATWEVKLGAAATAFLHKLQKGMNPWVPLKGHEKKTYKQLQEEAIESKNRDLAVLKANDGIWPGVRAPSHTLFLWASGSELTTLLEEDHMPNKFIPKHLRQQLAKAIPGLRPWEVLSIEQAMDQLTYGGEWYRKPLGSYTTGPPYIRHWNKDVMRLFKIFFHLSTKVYNRLERLIPGFDKVLEQVQEDAVAQNEARLLRRKAEREAEETGKYGRSLRP
ncbi:protein TIC 56, chloroplastic-like [Silene latifolia]|uniref:protein TIC 56, chloroplastic-like n=1 Tax=Silene latifolia TaxID=37657 RepID=UPI003D789475